MATDEFGLEVLNADECRALLATRKLGRIGASLNALPIVVPVDYALDGDSVVMCVNMNTALGKALVDCVVCLEVDNLDEPAEIDWGVYVNGQPHAVADPDEVARLETLGVSRWSEESEWLRLSTAMIMGRRRQRPLSPNRATD